MKTYLLKLVLVTIITIVLVWLFGLLDIPPLIVACAAIASFAVERVWAK